MIHVSFWSFIRNISQISLLTMFQQNFVLPTVNKRKIITSDEFYLNIFYHPLEMKTKTKKLTCKFDSISMWFCIDSINWNNRVPFQWIQFKICAQVSIEWQKRAQVLLYNDKRATKHTTGSVLFLNTIFVFIVKPFMEFEFPFLEHKLLA